MANRLGSTQTVIVCIPGTAGDAAVGPCPSGSVQSVTQAYLIAPTEAERFDLGAEPFDPAQAGMFFGFAFASTMFLYLTSLGLGYVLKMVRA
jgi:hypothetical protein